MNTELAAATIIAALDVSGSVLQAVDEPEQDVRSGGHYFDVECNGERLTVLVFDQQ